MDGLNAAIGASDPAYLLIAMVALGLIATLAILYWSPLPRNQADPLSSLFDGETLDNQLARISDPEARVERQDRAASAIRARMFARRSKRPVKRQRPAPHRADHFDHAAVLDHIAKVMRAGTEPSEQATHVPDTGDQWEEVLFLPPPSEKPDGVAKAA